MSGQETGVRSQETGVAPITVKQIVSDWLKGNGFEGLCNLDIQCGCQLDDFMPCDGDFGADECTPAFTGADGMFYATKAEAEATR